MTDSTTDLLSQNLLWSVGGLLVGVVLGALVRRTAGTTRADTLRSLLGVVIVVLLVGSQITYYRTTAEARRLTECFRPYYVEVSQALKDRSTATGATNAAQRVLLEQTLTGDPALGLAATREYLAALDRLEAARQAAPLPDPPACGADQ